MAASSNTLEKFDIEHRYITHRYTDIALIGCTSVYAFVATNYRGTTYIIRTSLKIEGDAWESCKTNAQNYLSGCAYECCVCIITRNTISVLGQRWNVVGVIGDFDILHLHACAMNARFLFLSYTQVEDSHPCLAIYARNPAGGFIITAPVIHLQFQAYGIRYIQCVGTTHTQFVIGTTINSVLYYVLTYNPETDKWMLEEGRRWVFFPKEDTPTHLLRDFPEKGMITCAAKSTLSFFVRNETRPPSVQHLSIPPSIIVDVHHSCFEYFVVHNSNNDLIFIDYNNIRGFAPRSTISGCKLLYPNHVTGIDVPKISHPYSSLSSTITKEGLRITTVLLPSGDLCIIKFSK